MSSPVYILKKNFASIPSGTEVTRGDDGKYYIIGTTIYFLENDMKDTAMFEEKPVAWDGFKGDLSKVNTFPTDNLFVNKNIIVYDSENDRWVTTSFRPHNISHIAMFVMGAILPEGASDADKKERVTYIKKLIK